ncbi:MAG: PAS domain-containing protein, partial [Chlamydiales bacterium]|nr:PAS domain-containing protein [Chlamydiales bacterium]
FIGKTIEHIVFTTLRSNTYSLIDLLQHGKDPKELVEIMEEVDNSILYGASLFDAQGSILYDSSLGTFIYEKYTPFYPQPNTTVLKALHQKVLYSIDDSDIEKEKLAHVAIAFQSHGTTYILRTAYSFKQLQALIYDFEFWYLFFCALALAVFSLLTYLIFHRINFPIRQIIAAIKPYQTCKTQTIPNIVLSPSIDPADDFYKLAETLNSLSERLIGQITAITDEKNEKEAILESLGEGVIAVDTHFQVRYVNSVAAKMLATLKRHLLGRSFLQIAPSSTEILPLLEKCKELLQTAQEKQMILTDSLALKDAKKTYLDLVAACISNRSGAILVLQDKSSHHRVLEVGKDFVANASHELRTPITIIKGFAETLQEMPELPKEMLVDITEKIVRNCQRMDNLVKNLLTLADIENLVKTRFQECDLILIIENCKQLVLSVYENAQISIEKNKERIAIFADSDIFELAIINLLSNACKYSPSSPQIKVEITEKKEEVIIRIKDLGIGIAEEDLGRIFDRFYTVDKARSRRLGGAGLGLSIVKTIIEKHDGIISATSQIGKGTTFT